MALLAVALAAGGVGCGRRGPPLPPEQVDPEAPRLLPLRQEGGQVVIHWYAPRLSSGGDVEDLRLRRAIVSYRLVDIRELAAEERASQRAGPEEEETTETAVGEDTPVEAGESAPPEAVPVEPEPAEPDLAEPEPAEPDLAEPEPAEPDLAEPEPAEPEPVEPEGEDAPAGEPLPEVEIADEAEPEVLPAEEPAPADQEPEADQETPEDPEGGDPEAEEAPGEEADEPEPDPEPTGVVLDYEDLEFELLSEIESEVVGEERMLELPVEPEWIGRRLEVRVRYEARGGASEESEPRSLDITGTLPAVEGVSVEVGPRELTVQWQDPRGLLEGAPFLSDPTFEVFRRRGAEPELLGRARGPNRTDADVIWGEEVCYSARLVMAGGDEERVLADPGPGVVDGPPAAAIAEAADAADESAEEAPAPAEEMPAPAEEMPAPAGEVAEEVPALAEESLAPTEEMPPTAEEPPVPVEEAPSEEEPWSPIPIRVPGAGAGAISVGPTSAEACVTPVDTFPPLPPSDLRLFWRAEQTDLSWNESTTPDVVGYHVYRSGPDGTGFERLTRSPLGQTTFSDAERDPRGRYRYAVSAVDGAEPPNESFPSDSRRVNPR